MAKPLINIVGHCTSTTARLLAVFPFNAGTRARIQYRIQNSDTAQMQEVQLRQADPYLLASFQLENLAASEEGTSIEYRISSSDDLTPIAVGDPSFRLIGRAGNLKFAVVSCNGEFRISDEHRRYKLWRALKEKVERGEIDFILHAGDQIYADAIKMQYGIGLTAQKLQSDEKRIQDLLVSEYRKIYVETWRAPAVAAVLESCPSMMMWDDHEIFDGYGSHDDDQSPAAKAFFRAAETAFLEFQAVHNPPTLGQDSHACGMVLKDSAFLFLDARTNRFYPNGIVLGKSQLENIKQWLSSIADPKLRNLYVITAVPIVHVAVVGFINFVHLIGWRGGIVEDLRDSWTAPKNQSECNELLTILFDWMKNHQSCKVTVVSGDAHVGTIGEIESKRAEHRRSNGAPLTLHQVVSSGIGSPPPQGLGGLILRMAAADKLNLTGADYQGTLLDLENRNSCILARRNFVTIQEEEGIVVRFFAEEEDRIDQIQHRWD